VIEGDASNIIGLVSIKHLIERHLDGRAMALRELAAPPLFLPETVPALKGMEKFKAGKTHMAFVVDEHGGIEGIITVTDVLKAVVGEMPTMGEDAEEPLIVQREDGSWLVDGRTAITELMVALRIKTLPKKHAGDYTTVGGLVMTRLGRIPNVADAFRFRGYRFEVASMDKRRVDKVLVTKMPRKVPASQPVTGIDG
jgi:putative hemolysin